MARVKTLPKDKQHKVSGIFPNFSATGSVKGMKKKYYHKDVLLVRCNGYIYNVDADPSIYRSLSH